MIKKLDFTSLLDKNPINYKKAFSILKNYILELEDKQCEIIDMLNGNGCVINIKPDLSGSSIIIGNNGKKKQKENECIDCNCYNSIICENCQEQNKFKEK